MPLLGLLIVLVVQPEELLRWTPTGRAWGWYRERRAQKIAALEEILRLRRWIAFMCCTTRWTGRRRIDCEEKSSKRAPKKELTIARPWCC